MKTIIYQQADDSAKLPTITLEFPDSLPGDEAQSMECEKICEEIRCILQRTAAECIMSTNLLSEKVQKKRGKAYEKSTDAVTGQF